MSEHIHDRTPIPAEGWRSAVRLPLEIQWRIVGPSVAIESGYATVNGQTAFDVQLRNPVTGARWTLHWTDFYFAYEFDGKPSQCDLLPPREFWGPEVHQAVLRILRKTEE